MDNIDVFLDRHEMENDIKHKIINFEKNKKDILQKRAFYFFGSSGSGKSYFARKILEDLNYEIILYDASDVRNKSIIKNIAKYNMSDKSVYSSLAGKNRKIAIIMDEIDGMNNGDKGGINALIKLIRPKKTNKQKKEDISILPIICIGNYHVDKKIKELIKVCYVYEFKSINITQTKQILNTLIPNPPEKVVGMIQGDLRKIEQMYKIYKKGKLNDIFKKKKKNINTKDITKKILTTRYTLNDHNTLMNETDRTSVGLLFHENLIDVLSSYCMNDIIPFYIRLLENICFSDYIDRITFQKQIWIFNEMSSLIKTFYNNKLLHDKLGEIKYSKKKEIRFTKVLTKYSTEYNNMVFINRLCHQLHMDKSDLFSFFINLREKSDEHTKTLHEQNDISKLDVNRIFRFIDNILYTDS